MAGVVDQDVDPAVLGDDLGGGLDLGRVTGGGGSGGSRRALPSGGLGMSGQAAVGEQDLAVDPAGKASVHAIALKALLGDGAHHLTLGERTLLSELLDRIAGEGAAAGPAD